MVTNAMSGSLTRTSVRPLSGTDWSTTAAPASEAWNWDRYFSSRTTVISSARGESLSGLAARITRPGSPTTSPWTHSARSRTVKTTSNSPMASRISREDPYLKLNGTAADRQTFSSSAQSQQLAGVLHIHSTKHVGRQADSPHSCCRRAVLRWRVVRVRDRAWPNPGTFPQGSLTPVSAHIVVARESVPSDQVGTEHEPRRVPANERSDRLPARGDFPDLPLGGTGVQMKVRAALEHRFQVVRVLGVAAHVRTDPRELRE